MKRCLILVVLLIICGCGLGSTPKPFPTMTENCTTPETIIAADLPQPVTATSYSYRDYLPPCYSADSESRYPVLYLIPGRSSASGAWFAAGLSGVVDRMILSEGIPPFLIVATENIENDPMADTIYNELIPYIESLYPIIDNRQYRAVAGGSPGRIAAYRLAFQHPNTFSSSGIFGAGAISGEEIRINEWLSSMNEETRIRVFMDTGDEDPLMLDRAKVLKSLLDDMGIENILHIGLESTTYWVDNFEIYLKWLTRDW